MDLQCFLTQTHQATAPHDPLQLHRVNQKITRFPASAAHTGA